MEISYDEMISEIKRDISHFENQVEYCMDQMRRRSYVQDKDALDEHFKRLGHFMFSLWNAENCLIEAQTRNKKALEAKTKLNSVYGQTVTNAGKWDVESDCEGKTRTIIHKECGKEDNDESCIGYPKGI